MPGSRRHPSGAAHPCGSRDCRRRGSRCRVARRDRLARWLGPCGSARNQGLWRRLHPRCGKQQCWWFRRSWHAGKGAFSSAHSIPTSPVSSPAGRRWWFGMLSSSHHTEFWAHRSRASVHCGRTETLPEVHHVPGHAAALPPPGGGRMTASCGCSSKHALLPRSWKALSSCHRLQYAQRANASGQWADATQPHTTESTQQLRARQPRAFKLRMWPVYARRHQVQRRGVVAPREARPFSDRAIATPPQSQVGRKKVGNSPGSGQDFRRAKADDEFLSIGNPCREGTYT